MFHRLARDEADCVSLTDWLVMELTVHVFHRQASGEAVYVFHRLVSDEADCACVSQTS